MTKLRIPCGRCEVALDVDTDNALSTMEQSIQLSVAVEAAGWLGCDDDNVALCNECYNEPIMAN